MSFTMPSIEIGGSASSGGGDSPTNAIGSIGQSYAELIADDANVFTSTGAKTFYMDAGTISAASPAQIGRVIDGVTITAALVAQNQALLNAIGAYCRANNISVVVGAQLANPPQGDWTYQWLNPAVEAGLPITQVEDVQEPECTSWAPPPSQWASYFAQSVAQIAEYYPNVKLGEWVGGSPTTAASFWTAYDSLAETINLPTISYAVADTSWNAPWVNSPSQWQSWLQQISAQVQQLGMTLTVLLDGTNGDTSGIQWTAQSEQHAAMVAQMAGVDVATILVRTWQLGGPNAVSPLNDPSTLGNDALEIAATYPLYAQNLITGTGGAILSSPSQAATTAGQSTSLGGITVTFGAADVATGGRFAIVINANTATFFAQAYGNGVVDGSGSGTIVLEGTQAEIDAELQSLTFTEAAGGSDTIDVELFNSSGRVADQQIKVSATVSGDSRQTQTLSFLPTSTNGGCGAGWMSETETLSGGLITSEYFTWNSTAINPTTGRYQTVKQDAIRLPDDALGVNWVNGVPENPAANAIGSDPLSTRFNANAFNPQGDYAEVTVTSTLVVFDPKSGDIESITDTLAPYPTTSGSGRGPAYLSSGGQQVTYKNTGDNPLWNAAWGNQFSSVVMTYGSQDQLLEMVYQGSAANGYQTIDEVFDPFTGQLMESIESLLPPNQFRSFVTGPVDITYYNTGDNPEWDETEWGSRAQVTVTWLDYYVTSVGSRLPVPMLTNWTGASQFGQQIWYSVSEQGGKILNGIGSPGNNITALNGSQVIGSCTVGSNGEWTLTLDSALGAGTNTVSISENDTRDGLNACSTLMLQVGSAFSGTAAAVAANIDCLQTLVASGLVVTVSLTDASKPTIMLSAAQAINDRAVVSRIISPHYLSITGVAAVNAASVAAQPDVASISVSDTLSKIIAGLPALQIMAANGILAQITLTDGTTPSAALTATQIAAGAAALALINSQYNLTITGITDFKPGVTLVSFKLLGPNNPELTFDDTVGNQTWYSTSVVFNPSGQIQSQRYDWRAGQPFVTTNLDYTNGQLYQKWDCPAGGGYVLTEYDTARANQWSWFVQTVNASNMLVSLDYTMRAGQTYAQILRNLTAGALASETDSYWTGGWQIVNYDLTGSQPWSDRIQVFNSRGQLTSDKHDWRFGHPLASSETWFDPNTGAITADITEVLNGSRIASDVTAASLSSVLALPNLTLVSVSDTAAGVASNLPALQSLAAGGKLGSIALTDSGTPTLTLSAAQFAADAAALACISGPYALKITAATAARAASLIKQAHVTQVSVSDTAAGVASNLPALQSLAAGGKLGSIAFTDNANFTLTIPGSQLNATVLANIKAIEATGRTQVINLKAGLNLTLTEQNAATVTVVGAANSDVINLGSGTDAVYVGSSSESVNGGSGNDIFYINAATAGATIRGGSGSNTLNVQGGGSIAMNANITGMDKVYLDDNSAKCTFVANATSGLVIQAGTGNDEVVVGAASQTVLGGSGKLLVQATATYAGAAVCGSSGPATLEITTGGTIKLNAADKNLTVQLDKSASLALGQMSFISAVGAAAGHDTITAGGANQTLKSVGGNDALIGSLSFGDTFVGTAAGLAGDTIKNFGGSDLIDISDLNYTSVKPPTYNASSGSLKLSDATHGVTLAMYGGYSSASFATMNDHHGGTLITLRDIDHYALCKPARYLIRVSYAHQFAFCPVWKEESDMSAASNPDEVNSDTNKAAIKTSGHTSQSHSDCFVDLPLVQASRADLRGQTRSLGSDSGEPPAIKRAALDDQVVLEMVLCRVASVPDVGPIAQALLNRFGTFGRVVHASADTLITVDGMNAAGVTALKTVEAAVVQVLRRKFEDQPTLSSSALKDYLVAKMQYERVEVFLVIYLNNLKQLIGEEEFGRGTIDFVSIPTRELIRRCLELDAKVMILAHNHPTGNLEPSQQDIDITKEIVEAAKLFRITVYDHIIVGRGETYSFRSHRLL